MGAFEFVINEGPQKGTVLPFPGKSFFLGAGEACHLRFDAALVQSKHAEVRFDANGVPWIRDLTGQHLLWLNGNPIEKAALASGSLLKVGQLEVLVRRSPSGARPAPTPLRTLAPPGVAAPRSASSTSFPMLTAAQPMSMALGDDYNEDTLVHRTVKPELLEPGTVIDGRYAITSKLAIGGMGEVYLAQHAELGKPMALKVMLPELSNDPEFVARFKREAIAASRIGQQNIVDISDFGRTPHGRFYFVMEYLDGQTLATLLHQEGALPHERALSISVQVARALAAAHHQGIVHRDLKPENVMVLQRPGQPDFVKVLDFGVAKVSTGPGQGGHTQVGLVVGTPQYMSPEQAKAIAVDTRSDIYSLGLIVYEMLAGRPAFNAETPSMLMVKHVTEAPQPLGLTKYGEVPPELEQLVMSMLAKEPTERPQEMQAVVEHLDDLWARLRAADPTLKQTSARFPTVATPQEPQVGVQARVAGALPAVGEVSPVALEADTIAMAPPPRSKLPLLVGGALLVAAVAAFVALRPTDTPAPKPAPPVTPVVVAPPPPPPPVPVEAQKVKLTFTSNEPAEVYEGDVLIGATPLALSRPSGELATLTFRAKGFEPLERKVKFESEQAIAVELEPEKKAAPVVKKKEPRPGTGELKNVPY